MSIYENTPAYCERAAHIAEKAMRIRKRKDLKNILASKLVLKDLERSNAMKKLFAIILLTAIFFAFTSIAWATQSTLAVNFKNYINTQNSYQPSSNGELRFTANAKVYRTQDSTTPLTGDAYAQEFKVTALYSGQGSASFGTDYRWDDADVIISGLSSGSSYTCQFGNTQARYYIKGSVIITYK